MRPAEATFRLRGWGRAGLAFFLLAWLAGWAAGEWFVLRVVGWGFTGSNLTRVVTSPAGCLVATFIVGWLILWTIAGIAAAIELGRLLAGRDKLTIGVHGVTVRRAIGPLALTKTFAPHEVRDIFVTRGGGSLMLDTTRGDILVTTFGTREERRAIERDYSRRDDALNEIPHGWSADGVTLLRELHDERTILRLARLIERTSGWSVRKDYHD